MPAVLPAIVLKERAMPSMVEKWTVTVLDEKGNPMNITRTVVYTSYTDASGTSWDEGFPHYILDDGTSISCSGRRFIMISPLTGRKRRCFPWGSGNWP